MENRRTETAREHDDKDITERAADAPDKTGRAGGDLARDVGTKDEERRVEKPETHTRVTKESEIAHDTDTHRNR